MRSLGSNVFDVPTAVSRPIQRCLKYPLFIGELIKVFFVKIRVFFFCSFFQNTLLSFENKHDGFYDSRVVK